MPPDFKPGDWIYFTFSRDKDIGGATVLARAPAGTEELNLRALRRGFAEADALRQGG